jgi:hypothetical protein
MNRIGIKSFSVQSLYSTLNIKNDLLFFEKLLVDHEGYKSVSFPILRPQVLELPIT